MEVSNPSGSQTWNCEATVNLKLIKKNSGGDEVRAVNHSFCAGAKSAGVESFCQWKNVVDPNNGFIEVRNCFDSVFF